ncbi:hypothetical protein [Saccharothrix lopnurensis]|uniref:Uncharacterized protein n=1 Tax=Saccharothrix lopnurensis TaxID=1670621 RepID=A0ABW1NXV9_9PSEU
MTKDKARKRAVRDVIAETGESYTRVQRRLVDDTAGVRDGHPVDTVPQEAPSDVASKVESGADGMIDSDEDNLVVSIVVGGELRLFVFPDWTVGGQCTARTRRGARCNNIAFDGGQQAGYETFSTGTRLVSVYGPLPDDVARKYLIQRCRVHDNDDAEAFCVPEWQHFDPVRHRRLTFSPSLDNLPLVSGTVPSPEMLAAAVEADYSPQQRQRLMELLAKVGAGNSRRTATP